MALNVVGEEHGSRFSTETVEITYLRQNGIHFVMFPNSPSSTCPAASDWLDNASWTEAAVLSSSFPTLTL